MLRILAVGLLGAALVLGGIAAGVFFAPDAYIRFGWAPVAKLESTLEFMAVREPAVQASTPPEVVLPFDRGEGSIAAWRRAEGSLRIANLERYARISLPRARQDQWREIAMRLDYCTDDRFMVANDDDWPGLIIADCWRELRIEGY